MANGSVELEGYIRHREISFNAGYRTTTTFDRIAPLVHLPSISEHSLNFGLIGPWYMYFAGDCRAQHRFGPNGVRMWILIFLDDPVGHRRAFKDKHIRPFRIVAQSSIRRMPETSAD